METGARPEEITQSEQLVRQTKASWETSLDNYMRLKNLKERDFISQQRLDEAMFTVPLASIGVILAILVLSMNVTIPVFIGGVLLIGIVVNNGIVMIDYINRLRKKEHPLREAILLGAKRRLRPIMMTTLTTSLALVPMALGFGEGSEINVPLARMVIGGMLVSALFTIFFVPTLYASIKEIGK